MRLSSYIVVLCGLLAGGAAFGQSAQNTSPATGDQGKMICKEIEVTGSLLPGPRICHTKAEWDEIQRQSEQSLREVQDNGSNPKSGQ